MWSLFNKKEDSGIFKYEEKLEPLKFSNNKTQADIVKEILEAISQGYKIIFIKGMCGTGKSAIALNLARHFSKTSIVVPIKTLQEQYEKDYTQKMFILKKNNSPLSISVIKGRNNFPCPYLGGKADNPSLPCTIEIKEKNLETIKKYLQADFQSLALEDIRRMTIASSCPFWSPILPADVNSKVLEKAIKKKYDSISGREYALFHRQKGCLYCDQYSSYSSSDVLLFNSRKYLLEVLMGRKPKTQLDIIDECDEFLDSFFQESSINLTRLLQSLMNLKSKGKKSAIQSLIFKINELILNYSQDDIKKLQETPILDLIQSILDNSDLAEDEENNYFNRAVEIAVEFEHLVQESYVSFNREIKEQPSVYINLVTINISKKFQELLEKSNILVLMSGTLHSEFVLKNIFKIKNFKTIEAETLLPGTITKYRTGKEQNCKYENFKSGRVTRESFLKALDLCIEKSKKPTLIHVNSFDDLPSSIEKAQYNLNNLITKQELHELQNPSQVNKQIKKFKNKIINILFTTKCSRGADFPGDECNSIILTRFPYPDINSLFWKILKRENPSQFLEVYLDKSRRELLQKIYRGVRSKTDHVLLLSPDSRVLDARIN